MRFITKPNLVSDLKNVPSGVSSSALAWLSVIEDKDTVWKNFTDVQRTYATVSQVQRLYVFNIKDYRLIVGISFPRQVVYYKTILSHSEYDKGDWKTKFSRSR